MCIYILAVEPAEEYEENYPGFNNYGFKKRVKRTKIVKKKGYESEAQGLFNCKETVSWDKIGHCMVTKIDRSRQI